MTQSKGAVRKLPVAIEPPRPTPKGKLGLLVELLSRNQGADIAELMAATGWQAHSVRGALSGAIRKGLGLAVASEKIGDRRVYRITTTSAT